MNTQNPAVADFTSATPERSHVRLGFVALSDAAPLAAAKVLELGRRHGLELELCRQPSWAAVRDKLLSGEIDAAHSLYGLVYGVQLGIGGPQADMAVLMVLNRNGQAITLSTSLARSLRQTGDLKATLATLGRPAVFAQTFPTGTHAMWLYYWLAAQGVHPLREVRSVVIPPPRMVDALAENTLDGFCAGEPWHAVAEARGTGLTVALSSEIWPDHPEKVLASRRDFASLYPNTARALIRTLLEACRWLDQPGHRAQVAHWLAAPELIGVPEALIAPRLQGEYDTTHLSATALPVSFFDEGRVNFPRPSDGLWFLTQFRRWGLLRGGVDHAAENGADMQIAATINQTTLYREAAALAGVPCFDEPRVERLIDGVAWDGLDASAYLHRFTVHA